MAYTKLKDLIHLYLGAPVLVCINIEGKEVIDQLSYKMLYEDIYDADMFFDPTDHRPYRLILRPLCDLTDEECLAGYEILHQSADAPAVKIAMFRRIIDGYYDNTQFTKYSGFLWVQLSNYLRSVGCDIDHLISTGQVIDAFANLHELPVIAQGKKCIVFDCDAWRKTGDVGKDNSVFYKQATIISSYFSSNVNKKSERLIDVKFADGRINKGHFKRLTRTA